MRKVLNFAAVFGFVVVDVWAASVTRKQSALQLGTKVRTRVETTGIYDQACYDKYYACMDMFCISDNELGGSCSCSDEILQYESALDNINKMMAEAERISIEEVEKVKAGAKADIIFSGTRQYDENNNVIETKATKDKETSKQSLWSAYYDVDDEDEFDGDTASLRGANLYDYANDLCVAQVGDTCSKDIEFLIQIYAKQITSDCKGLANSIEKKRQEAKSTLSAANASVRAALKESLEESNKYDRGTCMAEYRKCMQGEDACGSDWEQCVFTIADENMQNNKARSVIGTKVETKVTYDITSSTMERLESKRFVCERVLDSCVAVRDYVWNDFLRDIAPTIRLAESKIESRKRQSCLKDISDCIQTACKDDIVGKGVDSMDACLSRPEMAWSFCKIQIEPCERMEPQIFEYVKDKLDALRVDACTKEVKACYTADDRCGADFSNCIGMDYKHIHDMCPVELLVACKKGNPDFNMSDLDSKLMGLFLNIDNKLLEDCENIAEKKMLEICGSTTDCNILAADDSIGTGSVILQKVGAVYRLTGMLSFGQIKLADLKDKKHKPGEVLVDDYIKELYANNADNTGLQDSKLIIGRIEQELKNIAGNINKVTEILESDQKIQYCINGRDLSNINGSRRSAKNVTQARFPHLLYQYRTMIALSALRQAQDNYNKKVEEKIAEASKTASADVAQYMCQKLGNVGKGFASADQIVSNYTLTPPYAISYDIAAGITDEDLKKFSSSNIMSSNESGKLKSGNGSGVLRERFAMFDRDSRVCKICTTVTKQSCDKSWKASFSMFGSNGANKTDKCTVEADDQQCEEMQM